MSGVIPGDYRDAPFSTRHPVGNLIVYVADDLSRVIRPSCGEAHAALISYPSNRTLAIRWKIRIGTGFAVRRRAIAKSESYRTRFDLWMGEWADKAMLKRLPRRSAYMRGHLETNSDARRRAFFGHQPDTETPEADDASGVGGNIL